MRRGAVLAVGFVLVVAGCTAGGPDSDPGSGSGGMPGVRGPLDQLIDTAWGGSIDPTLPDAVTLAVADTTRRENMVAACMNEQGFEYIPMVPDPAAVKVVAEGLDRESRAFAEQFGFGIVNQPESTAGEISWEGMDPNWPALQAMSDGEREAYEAALHGEITKTETDEQGNESYWREGGCLDQTFDGGFAVADDASDFLAALPDDGAFDELDHEWSACMREAGFEHESPAAASTALNEEYVAMLDDHSLEGDDVAGFGEREKALAVATWDCKAETGYEARFRVIRDQVQQAWIDEHRAELDEWLAAVADR